MEFRVGSAGAHIAPKEKKTVKCIFLVKNNISFEINCVHLILALMSLTFQICERRRKKKKIILYCVSVTPTTPDYYYCAHKMSQLTFSIYSKSNDIFSLYVIHRNVFVILRNSHTHTHIHVECSCFSAINVLIMK